jgi:hypothetical protein
VLRPYWLPFLEYPFTGKLALLFGKSPEHYTMQQESLMVQAVLSQIANG